MKWIKKGLIFAAPGDPEWMTSHAGLPVAQRVDGDLFRVYFSGRDQKGRAQVGYFEIDLTNPGSIRGVSKTPVIPLGPLGAFDENGVTSSWVTQSGDRLFQYYTGWTLGVTVPFYFHVGLAVSEDGGRTFRKASPAPLLDRTATDPYLTASPCVLIENGVWRMWYVSGVKWTRENGAAKHYYHIRYAESGNGLDWERTGIVCIDFKSAGEYAIARPCVLREGNLYRMWYSYRGERYRIGYAESRDGLSWERKDELAGIDVSESGWDSEMVEYAFVFDHKGRRYMFYNGNGYGKTGIGLAVLED